MGRITKRFVVLLTAFCVAFTGLPLMTGTIDAHAASKFTIKSASAASSSSVKLTWKKYKKSNTYQIFRDGELIATVSKTTYTDKGLNSATEYGYKVKALQKYTKKQKQWFNKKTGAWQTKKPAKKYRGKSKTVKLVKYKNLGTSKVRYVTTKSELVAVSADDGQIAADGSSVKVYALSSINVTGDSGYTRNFQYNNNGLLKKTVSDADPDKHVQAITRTEEFSYTGTKVKEMLLRKVGPDYKFGDGTGTKYAYIYKNGKLSNIHLTYPDINEDGGIYDCTVNSLGRVESIKTYYDYIDSSDEKDYFFTDYKYNGEGYLIKRRYEEKPWSDVPTKYYYDERGNLVKHHFATSTAPGGGVITYHDAIYENTYTDGRLTKTVETYYTADRTETVLNYKEISIPEECYKAFVAQQHDIIFRYVYWQNHDERPIGLVG